MGTGNRHDNGNDHNKEGEGDDNGMTGTSQHSPPPLCGRDGGARTDDNKTRTGTRLRGRGQDYEVPLPHAQPRRKRPLAG
jgi:hypothetical protein